jgi:large subunit ribosomal protein L24
MKIRLNDNVKILSGNNRGKVSKVTKVLASKNKLYVDGVGIHKKFVRGQGVVDIQKPINPSIVSLMCPKCGKQTRVGFMINEKGFKNRICVKCKAVV